MTINTIFMLIEVCQTIIRLEVIGKVSFKMVYRKNGSFNHNFYVFSLFLPNVLCCMIHCVVGWPSSRLKTTFVDFLKRQYSE